MNKTFKSWLITRIWIGKTNCSPSPILVVFLLICLCTRLWRSWLREYSLLLHSAGQSMLIMMPGHFLTEMILLIMEVSIGGKAPTVNNEANLVVFRKTERAKEILIVTAKWISYMVRRVKVIVTAKVRMKRAPGRIRARNRGTVSWILRWP